jgi:hypothetical protein
MRLRTISKTRRKTGERLVYRRGPLKPGPENPHSRRRDPRLKARQPVAIHINFDRERPDDLAAVDLPPKESVGRESKALAAHRS